MLTRRGFGFGLLGSTALLAAGALPLAWSVDEDAVLIVAILTLYPPADGRPSPTDVDAPGNLRAYLAKVPPGTAWEARGLLRLIEWGALSAGGRFTHLDEAARLAYLSGLATSRLYPERLMAHSLKQLCAVAYWQHPKTWVYLGYDGPLVGR